MKQETLGLDTSVYFGRAWWRDGTAHGSTVISPGFRTAGELRVWCDQQRVLRGALEGFELHCLRRETVNGKPFDTVLPVRETNHLRAVEAAG